MRRKNEINTELLIDGLFITITNVNFDNNSIQNFLNKVKSQKKCDTNFSVQSVWNCDEDIRSLKSLILFGLKGMAAYAHHARVLGYKDENVDNFSMKRFKQFQTKIQLMNCFLLF